MRIRPRSRVVAAALLVAACTSAPRPGSSHPGGLHFAAQPTADFTDLGGGHLQARVATAEVAIALDLERPRIEVEVDNGSDQPVVVRLGPQSARQQGPAIGELQLRPRQRAHGEGRSDYLPFLPHQPIELAPGMRAVLYVDDPLGRAPAVGDFVLLLLEVEAGGRRDRRTLPLLATNRVPPRR